MQTHSKEEIDSAREEFRQAGYPEINVEFGSRKYSYFVLPQELNPELPNFVLRVSGKPSDGIVLGVSNSLDPIHRVYATLHEFIEFSEISGKTPDRCKKALEKELALVPERIKSEYIEMRRGFFRELIRYCFAHPEGYTSRDIDQFGKSLERLNRLTSGN